MPRVTFNDFFEFVGEMERDRDTIDRQIVRTTCSYEREQMFTILTVIAAYTVGGDVVQLTVRVGSYMNGIGDEAAKLVKIADATTDSLGGHIARLKLEQRHGSFR